MNQQLLKEILRTTPVYDPLVVYVNRHWLMMNQTQFGIKGKDYGADIKVLYERNGIPNQYSQFNEYCCIAPITKHSILQPTEVILWYKR